MACSSGRSMAANRMPPTPGMLGPTGGLLLYFTMQPRPLLLTEHYIGLISNTYYIGLSRECAIAELWKRRRSFAILKISLSVLEWLLKHSII